jgi:SAM-dependent methyltransferase
MADGFFAVPARVARGAWGRLLSVVRGEPRAFAATKPEVFSAWALDGRAAGMERAHGPVARRILERLSLPAHGWYLDIGCGNGYTVRWMASRLPSGRAIGLDAAPEMIRQARELSSGSAGVEFHQAAFPDHDLPAASFDAIFSMETFYYLPDISAGLAACRRLLKPGGVFVSAVDFYAENPDSHGWPQYVGVRMALLSAAQWSRAFEDAGFAPVEQERIVVPGEEAAEPWHATVGSLVTRGYNPG